MTSSPSSEHYHLPPLARGGHAGHVKRCLTGLPSGQVDLDSSRLAIAFYCIGSLDLLGMVQDKISEADRETWREWIWEQQVCGEYGTGFRPSPFMTSGSAPPVSGAQGSELAFSDYDLPHIIMTYTALLTLAILRDDFTRLDKRGLLKFLKACQREDGSFSTVPKSGDTDLRTLYCAFVICSLLNDWSGVDVDSALAFVASCRSYEGGYGQTTYCEAQGGTTYIALAAMHLAPVLSVPLTKEQKQQTIRWLLHNQHECGGFSGRTDKAADACYCFWMGASLKILGASDLVDTRALGTFLADCQFKFGGIAKAPGEHPDPYHTYLTLAALSMFPPPLDKDDPIWASWHFEPLDPLINAREGTARWARERVAVQHSGG